MKHLFTSYSIIVFALFLSACNDSNSHDSPESKLHDIKVNYSSSDPEHTVTDRHFYIYNEADSLVQHISTSEKLQPYPYLKENINSLHLKILVQT